ncbi:Alpha subunit, partial [Aspergillus sp. HF37]
WKGFAGGFVGNEGDGEVKSTHAVEWLADVYLAEKERERQDQAVKMLKLLRDRYDPVRRNYWDYRIKMAVAA